MVTIDTESCIGCGACVKDCIASNLYMENGKATVRSACFSCGHCVAVCPQNACALPSYDMADVEAYDDASFRLAPKNVLHAIKFRRSVRQYQQKPVPQDVLERVIQAGRYTETAVNVQDVEFFVVQQRMQEYKPLAYEGWLTYTQSDDNVPKNYQSIYENYKKDPVAGDRLFYHAPAVIVVCSNNPVNGALAAANMETMAVALGLGMLVSGQLTRAVNADDRLQAWLGIKGKSAVTNLLVGYPAVTYHRTAPRKPATVHYL